MIVMHKSTGGEDVTEPRDARDEVKRLYEVYSDDVYKYALYSLRNPEDANDAVQEVFFRAYRSWYTFRQEAQARTWLLIIARHHIYDVLRKRKKDQTLIERYSPPVDYDNRLNQDSLIDMEQMVRSLKSSYRNVFILRHINALPVKDVASILGWSESKVRTTDHRAIALLKQSYVRAKQGVNETNEG